MRRVLSIVASVAWGTGIALAAPVTITLDGALVSRPGGNETSVSATLVYDAAAAASNSPSCESPLLPCFGAAGESLVYMGAVESLTITIGEVILSSLEADALVADNVPLTLRGSPSDGVSLGRGAMSASVGGDPVFGFVATSGLSFVDASSSALSGTGLEDVDLASGLFEILDTELYLLTPFGDLETRVIKWNQDRLQVQDDDPVSTPLPMSAWLILGPVLAWTFVSRRRQGVLASSALHETGTRS